MSLMSLSAGSRRWKLILDQLVAATSKVLDATGQNAFPLLSFWLIMHWNQLQVVTVKLYFLANSQLQNAELGLLRGQPLIIWWGRQRVPKYKKVLRFQCQSHKISLVVKVVKKQSICRIIQGHRMSFSQAGGEEVKPFFPVTLQTIFFFVLHHAPQLINGRPPRFSS